MFSNTTRAWFSWGLGATFVFYLFLLQASTSVMVLPLMQTFNVDSKSVSLLSASYFYTYIFFQMPAGSVVDRFGAKKVLCISIAGCAIATLLFAQAHTLLVAEIARALMGLMTASGVVGTFYLASRWFPKNRFTLLVGLTEMMGMLGGAIGQEILAFSVTHCGWRATMLFCAIFGGVLCVLVLIFMRNGPDIQRSVQASAHSMFKEFQQVLKHAGMWINGLCGGLIFAIVTGFAALWAVPFLMKLYSLNLDPAAGMSSLIFWGVALGGPLVGALAGKFSKHYLLLMGIGTGLTLLICLIVIYVNNLSIPLMSLCLFLIGLCCSAYTLMFPLAGNMVPKDYQGTAMGFTNMMCIAIGAPIYQPLIGWLLEVPHHRVLIQDTSMISLSDYHSALSILPIGLVLSFVCLLFLNKIYFKETSH